MNPDEPDYFCRLCYHKLPAVEECYCPGCDKAIDGPRDYVDEHELRRLKAEDERRLADAIECGLVIPKSGEASNG